MRDNDLKSSKMTLELRKKLSQYRIIIITLIAYVFYWIIESFMDTYVFQFDPSIINNLIFLDVHEIWMRILIFSLFLFIGMVAQIILGKRKKAEMKLKQAENELRILNSELELNINDRTLALRERVKELTCLYNISQLAEKKDMSIKDLLTESLNFIRSAWQFPEVTYVRINLNEMDIRSDNFMKSSWKQEVSIKKTEEIIGKIVVGYCKEMPQLQEGPFLKEERSLINAIAEIIGRILERKEVEQKLKESEEKYRTLVHNVSDIILESDLEGNREFVSPQITKITGFSLEESLLMNEFDLIHPDDVDNVKQAIQVALTGNRELTVEYRLQHKEGHYIPVLARGMIVQSQSTQKIIAIISDITEIKKIQDLILEENKKLEELNKIKRSLIIRVSHELKTPLNSILGASHLLQNYHKDKMNKDVLEYNEIIHKGGLRLKILIDGLLDISRLDNEQFELKRKNENLTVLIKNCVIENKIFANTRKVTIEIEVPKRVMMHIDKIRIEQVITNILSNAIKFTPPTGSIYISLAENDESVDIFIRDTGIGLTNQEKLRLFTKFGKIERYGQKFDVDVEGSGLGLYISKEIVELHGGEILVHSEGRNKGSLFTIKLLKVKA